MSNAKESTNVPPQIRDQATQRTKDLLFIGSSAVEPEDVPQDLFGEYQALRKTKIKPQAESNSQRVFIHLNTWRKPNAYNFGFIGALDHSSEINLASSQREAVLRQALVDTMIERIHAELNNESFHAINRLEGRMAGYRWSLGLSELPKRYEGLKDPEVIEEPQELKLT